MISLNLKDMGKKQQNYLNNKNWCKYNLYWFLQLLLPFSDKGFRGSFWFMYLQLVTEVSNDFRSRRS